VSLSATPGYDQISSPAADAGGADQPIAKVGGALTAFVGRALRGPVHRAVAVNSFADFQQIFGGLWQPSTLSYAVEQFFEQGGRRALIVRVINGGAPPTISLPCGSEMLTLESRSPGTREFLRAAVDYDNLSDEEAEDSFNLVVQRVRAPGSERIELQETFRRVSVNPGTQRFVGNVLHESQLVRIRGPVPGQRPEPTSGPGVRAAGGYCNSNNDGDDGAPLTDYDVIGSATQRTGLFALGEVANISYLYIPPLARNVDIGASTLLVAERFCRERRVLLIVDPPVGWQTLELAVRGSQLLDFHSEHALMYFPRLLASDRLRARTEVFPNGAAVAGMLARSEEHRPVWQMSGSEPDHVLRSGVRLSINLSERERWRLAMYGINTLRTTRTTADVRLVPRTMAGSINSAADWAYLSQQRLASFLVNSIERGTRWAAWSRCDAVIWARVERQVTDFLRDVTALGAFPSAPHDRAFLAVCDARINDDADVAARRLKILVAFAGTRRGDYRGFLITHSMSGSSSRAVAVNRLEMPIVVEPRIAFDNEWDAPTFDPEAQATG